MLLAAQRRAKNAPPIATDAISFAVPRFHSFFLYLCILHLPFCIFHFASSILHLSRRVTVALASIAHRLRVDHRSLSQIHHARIETFYAARFFAGHEIAARLVGAGCPVRVRSSRRTQKPTTRERLNGIARVAAQKIPKPREFPVVACGKYRRACISPPFWRG